MRFFNTAGPVNCNKHYCLSPLSRFDLAEVLSLIRQEKYFVLHAPRQSGKTSCLFALNDHLDQGGEFHALYINVEPGQTARDDVKRGIRAVLTQLAYAIEEKFPGSQVPGQIYTAIEEKG